jgi:hypothetical protein
MWMYLATGLVIVYQLFVVSLRAVAPPNRQLLGQIAVPWPPQSTAVLASTCFIQASVVPSSLAAGETEGIPLLTH